MAGVYILIRFVIIFLDVMLVAMLARAIVNWFFMGDGTSPLMSFLYVITEPLIMPVRLLCGRFGWFQGVPIDMPMLVTTVVMSLLSLVLSGISPL